MAIARLSDSNVLMLVGKNVVLKVEKQEGSLSSTDPQQLTKQYYGAVSVRPSFIQKLLHTYYSSGEQKNSLFLCENNASAAQWLYEAGILSDADELDVQSSYLLCISPNGMLVCYRHSGAVELDNSAQTQDPLEPIAMPANLIDSEGSWKKVWQKDFSRLKPAIADTPAYVSLVVPTQPPHFLPVDSAPTAPPKLQTYEYYNQQTISELNDYFATGSTSSMSLQPQKIAYLEKFYSFFEFKNSSTYAEQLRIANLFLKLLFDMESQTQTHTHCLLAQKRWVSGVAYSYDTHSMIKALRFIESTYQELSGVVQNIRQAHPEIANSKYNRCQERVAYHSIDETTTSTTTSHSMTRMNKDLAIFHKSGDLVYLVHSNAGKLSTQYLSKKLADDSASSALIPQRSYEDLERSFARGLDGGDKKAYVRRVMHYFDPANQDADRAAIFNEEVNNFVSNLINNQGAAKSYNFCRLTRKALFSFGFGKAEEGYTRSYSELLRFFLDKHGFDQNQQLNALGQTIQPELNKIAKMSKGYFNQITSTKYVAKTISMVITGNDVGSTAGNVLIAKAHKKSN